MVQANFFEDPHTFIWHSSTYLKILFQKNSRTFKFNATLQNWHLLALLKILGKNLEEGNIGCGIFVELQKAFDTA